MLYICVLYVRHYSVAVFVLMTVVLGCVYRVATD